MKLLKLLILVGILAAAYFGFLRDKYVQYPIDISLTNLEGQNLSVRLLGRSAHIVQFKRSGEAEVIEYRVDQLDSISKAKLAFLPNVRYRKSAGTSFGSATSETSDLHMQGMVEELEKFEMEMKLLRVKLKSQTNSVERNHVQREIDILDEKTNKLKYKIETRRAHSR